MKRSRKIAKKFGALPVVISSFAGMMMAVPFALAFGSSANYAAAQVQSQSSDATVSMADFAKFAYAYNQGYEARAVSVSSSSDDAATTCSEASVTAAGASAASVADDDTSLPAGGSGGGGAKPVSRLASMVNSYNTYTSMVYNSSSITNTNSNNNVGSNNSTSTEVRVEDSRGVLIGISNDPSATQMASSNSFNKDSYNTKTDTTIVNDSFNKETNVAINSGNTSTETTTVNKTEIDDSYNTKNVTEDSNNTVSNETTMTNEVNHTVNKTIDSYNTTETDVDVDVDADLSISPQALPVV